jgi:ABC-type nitrate/sulfonate/bicarbonate transport system substrate-binding protein
MTRPEIDRVEDLKGRKIGISRLGAVPHFAIQLLLERFSVKDATVLQMGGQPEAAAGGAARSMPRCFRYRTPFCSPKTATAN